MAMLIAGRSVQGIAGGGLIQLITITISDLFSVRYYRLYRVLVIHQELTLGLGFAVCS